ncbi:MAG: NUDIX hydrolase [Chloroflexi bacterium]|nr:NUDIX hydrolase [Chloroflexota bacterium]
MKRFLLQIWRILPFWVQRLAAAIIRPRYQVAVGALIFNDQGELLLCEHTYRRLHPWGLPGGDLKFGEDPVEGIKREILEETGLEVQDARLLLVENSAEIHHIALTYLCTGVSGTFIPNEEVSSIRYFDTGSLPGFFQEHSVTIEKCLAILNSEK